MEIVNKKLTILCGKPQTADQLTLEEDCIVPDSLPDAGKIIQKKAAVHVEEMQVGEGKVQISGELRVSVLYIADSSGHEPARLDTRIPFRETQTAEGAQSRETAGIVWELEDLSVSLINSRKLSVRALLTFRVETEEVRSLETVEEVRGVEEVSVRKKTLELLQQKLRKKDLFRVKEEVSLPSGKPNIGRVLWESVQPGALEVRPLKGNLEIRGELSVFVLYEGDGEDGGRQWVESAVPFRGSLPCQESVPEQIARITAGISQAGLEVQEDEDGEKRLLALEAAVDLDIRMYEEVQTEILEDIYSPMRELHALREELCYESLLMQSSARVRTTGRLNVSAGQPPILQICSGTGEVRIDETQVEENHIVIEGAVNVNALYTSADDRTPLASLEGAVPFRHEAELPRAAQDCGFSIQTRLEQLVFVLADSGTVEVKISVSLQIFAVERSREAFIVGVEEREPDRKKLQELPGVIGYIVQPGDSLWSISRAWYTTPEKICRLNGIAEHDLRPGMGLVLVKTV